VLKHKAARRGLDWIVESAGTESYHIGSAPHKYSQKVCRSRGVDISLQRARKFTVEDFSSYDKIYAMADDVYDEIRQIGGGQADMSKVDFFLNELTENSNASVPDPWYGDEAGYLPVYDMIERTCDAIIEKYG
jgi:protein-tyrosine phosphatase